MAGNALNKPHSSTQSRLSASARRHVVIARCGAARAALALGPNGLVLSIAGELDVDSQPGLAELVSLTRICLRPIEASLAGVRFADSHGLNPLLADLPTGLDGPVGVIRFGAVSAPAARILDLLAVPYARVVAQPLAKTSTRPCAIKRGPEQDSPYG